MRSTATLTTAAVALLASGCGEEKSYSNNPRPASPIVVTAAITKNEVAVSPKSFGAGPISLVITNQTSAAQQITFETAGTDAGFTQQTGPINPGGTATLKANVEEPGKIIVKVQGDGIAPAQLQVTEKRKSAQDELLQP